MANVRLTYNLPVARVDGKALPLSEIKHVEVFISADGGANFGKLRDVLPPATEYVQTELEAGLWVFRLIVVDTLDQRSAAVDVSVTIVPALPNPVSNVQAFVE